MTINLATVILPTHSDPGTLGYAISSVLNQTEARIELIIVLDGATSETKATAQEWVQSDSRVRVLDLPKGTGRGADNRHLAVLSAQSDVIFYIDEDDLWMPNHVSSMLGRISSHQADVVCSTVASVREDNGIEIAPFSQASGQLRESLRSGTWRALFKIHMCHTKKSYEQLSQGWAPRLDGEKVKSLTMELAHERFKWVAIHEVTALSFHGTPRRDAVVSARSRSSQLRRFWRKIRTNKLNSSRLIRKGSIAYYFVSVVYHINPRGSNLDEYLKIIRGENIIGFPVGSKSPLYNSSHTEDFPLTKKHRNVAHSILDYHAGKKISIERALLMYKSLTRIVCGPPIWTKRQGLSFLIGSTMGKY